MTREPRLFLGVDAGSTTVKAVAVGEQAAVVAASLRNVSGDYARDIAEVLDELGGSERYKAVAATGYAQDLVGAATRTLSEVSCHARGASFQVPGVEVVIDIGGQDLKVVRISPQGRPVEFAMNDKCAAGTGRFLDVMARALGTDAAGLSALAGEAAGNVRITSMCTVFAESEVVTLLSRGASPADVARGLIESIAERIYGMAVRLASGRIVAVSGGGALNSALVAAVGRRLGRELVLPAQPQLTGALGAALVARDQVLAPAIGVRALGGAPAG